MRVRRRDSSEVWQIYRFQRRWFEPWTALDIASAFARPRKYRGRKKMRRLLIERVFDKINNIPFEVTCG